MRIPVDILYKENTIILMESDILLKLNKMNYAKHLIKI